MTICQTFPDYCYFFFDDNIGFLSFDSSELCSNIGWYGDFMKNSCIVAIVLCLDILTVMGVRRASQKLKTGMTDATIKKISLRDRRFLKQTVIQGFVFMLELLTYLFHPTVFCESLDSVLCHVICLGGSSCS
ncbi:hypothetical protein CAEBREN_29887 [Caenorhabditis brenneri]|uniref:7TM GPCR serpentine receptor class x (Srx) domain-containing protein n=1 Tax=Caenorhabditis brenneri TaxID=135651 RepID=G0NHN4_CAEBE|nr:hypothetical protein CAEBREN_29887 [Caenorhabditis brenneri]